MSATLKKWWTRKDVATLLEITVDQVRKNEKKLGLDKARQDFSRSCARYISEIAARELSARGYKITQQSI